MRKVIIIIIFLIGLGIFTYPMISNMLSTKVHQSVIKDYSETVSQLDDASKKNIVDKADVHNKKLNDEPIDFVDPFDNGTENSGNTSYYNALNIGPALGTLEIPGIGVNLPIYHGTSDDVLSKGVGHLENSSFPLGDIGTHTVLTAHRGLPSSKLFRNINDVAVGEEFQIQVLDEVMTYEVYEIDIVLPNETDWLQMDEDRSLLTLLSCEPYMINTHRMLVKGELIGSEKVTEDPTKEPSKKKAERSYTINFILMGSSLLGIFLILFFWFKKRKREVSNK